MKIVKRFLILLLIPWALLALLYGWVVLRSPESDSAPLVRTCDRRWVWKGDPVRMRLHINGDRVLSREITAPGEPFVVMLVIDHSGSMGSGPESPLQSAKMAASYFCRVVASAAQPVGVLGFDEGSQLVHPIGPDGQVCGDAILAIPPGGGTDIAQAVDAAHRQLSEALQRGPSGDRRGLLVLLSDGGSASSPALAAARRAKDEGLRIITIGLGTSIDEELLRGIASSDADFRHTVDVSALGDVYMNIAGEMAPVIGHAAVLSEKYNYGGFTLEQPVAGFHSQVNEEEGCFEVQLPVLFAQRVALPYDLRARKIGLYRPGLESARLSFFPDPEKLEEQDKAELESSLAPPLLVISPFLLFLFFLPALAYLLWRLLHALLRPKPKEVKPPAPVKELVPPPPLELGVVGALGTRQAEPTLFVGLGRSGTRVLAEIAGLLARDRYLRGATPPFRLLAVDSRTQAAPEVTDQRFTIHQAQLPVSLAPAVEHLQGGGSFPPHLAWLPRGPVREAAGADLDLSAGTRGNRWAARLALFHALGGGDQRFLAASDETVGWLRQQNEGRIVLVGSLESGTSGLMTDAAHLFHAALPEERRARFPVYALALADVPVEHPDAAGNQRAFLAELDRQLVAARWPQPMVYRPSAPDAHAYLESVLDRPVYDGVFLLQSPVDAPERLQREFFSAVGALGHTLTEESLAKALRNHLDGMRESEEASEQEHLGGVVHTAALFVVRFPVPELLERLNCRFLMELLGSGRLVGAAVSEDGRRLRLPAPPREVLAEAMDAWPKPAAGGEDTLTVRLYQAYCRTVAARKPEALRAAFRQEGVAAKPPELGRLRVEIRKFATAWLRRWLNGASEISDDEAAAWRPQRITWLHAVLEQLTAFGEEVLEREGGPVDIGDEPLTPAALVTEIHGLHSSWHEQVRGWLEALVDTGCAGTGGTTAVDRGLYRWANDRYQELGRQLDEEAAAPWQHVLGDAEGPPQWTEDALYATFFHDFLTRERGFLLRWIWELAPAAEDAVPELRLRLMSDANRSYTATDEGVGELRADLLRVAESRCRALDSATIFDKLRSAEGKLGLELLAAPLAERVEAAALRVNRQSPGGDRIRRRVLAMMPDLEKDERERFSAELRRLVPADVETVPHNDPNTLRLLILDSVVPLAAVLLRRDVRVHELSRRVLPFVLFPERQGERLRHLLEERLGVVPAPVFHPLVRLLAAAPLPRSEWVGVLAEDCLAEGEDDDGRDTLVVVDGDREVPIVLPHQYAIERTATAWVWAVLNIAYCTELPGLESADLVRAASTRWRDRPAADRIARLAAAAATWQERAVETEHPPSRRILEQIALLIRLEHELEQQREATA